MLINRMQSDRKQKLRKMPRADRVERNNGAKSVSQVLERCVLGYDVAR